MFKKMLSAFSVSTVVLSLFFAKGAKADQVAEEAAAPEDTAGQELSSQAATTVSQAELDTAKGNLDRAKTATAQGQAEVNEAQAASDAAQAQVDQASQAVKEAEAAGQATEADKAATQAQVTEKTAALKTAEENLAQSQSEVADSQIKVDTQAKTSQAAQEAVKEQETKVSQAQAELDAAQAGQGSTDAESAAKLAKAKEAVEASKKAVDAAQAEVDKAGQSDNERQQKLAQAAAKKSQADDAASTAKQDLDTASAQADKTQAQMAQAKSDLDAAQASANTGSTSTTPSNNKNTFYMTPEYIAALKQLADPNTPASQISQIQQTLIAVNDRAKSYNNYVADPNDSQTLIDTNNIPYDVRRELSQFASDLINQMRAQMGTGETLLTPSSLDFADKVAREYQNDNWSWDLMNRYRHDAWGINRVAREYGLVTTNSDQEQQGIQYYENAYIWKAKFNQMSLADMKERIYFSLVEFMYNGYEWDHAKSISGLNTGSQKNYLGIDFSVDSDITVAHFTMVSEDQVKYASKNNFDTTPLSGSGTVTPSNPQALAQAQAAYDAAKTANDQAQADKTAAQATYEQAQVAVAEAQAALEAAQGEPLAQEAAQAALDTAKQQLAADQAALEEAQATADAANNNLADQATSIASAQAALDAAKAALEEAQETAALEEASLAQAQSELATAQTKRDAAQADLAAAQDNLANLENAQDNLAQAQVALAAAEADLAEKTANLDAKNQRLAELKETQGRAQAAYDRLAAQFQAQENNKRDDYYRGILDQTEQNLNGQGSSQPNQTVAAKDPASQSNLVSNEDSQATEPLQFPTTDQATSSTAHATLQTAFRLPNTGSTLSIWLTIIGLAPLLTFYFFLHWKHK